MHTTTSPWPSRLAWPALLLSLALVGCVSYQSMEGGLSDPVQTELVARFEAV